MHGSQARVVFATLRKYPIASAHRCCFNCRIAAVALFRGGKHMFRTAIALLISAICFSVPASAQRGPNAFTFVAFGDMPYRKEDVIKVDRLIAAINRLKPAFSIHVGDIKSGRSSCDNRALTKAFAQINRLKRPVVYTIGDNEWTDCGRKEAGKFDPSGRLKKVRELAFSKPGTSLGKTTRVIVDPDIPEVFTLVPLMVPENGPS
jgi:hypothetical protein